MKCKIPEISWHNRDPVLSVDIQAKSNLPNTYRLASGGTDAHVLIWHLSITADESDVKLDLATDLTRHQRAVNVVRWSPNGELLASGDDESVVFIWKQKAESDPLNILDNTSEQDKEVWITLKVLRGHMEDVYDLSWAPNSQFLVSGSVDNSAMIWDVHKGKSLSILNDHKGFVQGVAWDPKNQYIATLSTDRFLRIFDINSKRVLYRINKGVLPVAEGHELHGQRMRLFHDDTLQTFFRRLCFTPDGKLLLTPAGVTEYEGVTRPLHTTYAFSRYALRQPAIVLPCPDQYTVAVRCCPVLFRLRPHNPELNAPIVPLPYRMIFAVATRCSVYFYDTQQRQPFAVISNIHYTRLTDATWSSDGRIVVVSSTDGFCSLITFEPGELGDEYEDAEAVLAQEVRSAVIKKPKKQKENQLRKPSTDEQAIEKVEKVIVNEVREPLLEKIVKSEQKIEPDNVENKEKIPTTNDPNMPVEQAAGQEIEKVVASIPTAAVLPVEIVLDKEILSSNEKFESPEKIRPATPILVRRHPRTPSSGSTSNKNTPASKILNSIKSTEETNDLVSAGSSSKKHGASPRPQKHATPIAVRRTPRALISAPKTAGLPTTITPLEEALDAWPVPIENKTNVEEQSIFKVAQDLKAEMKEVIAVSAAGDVTCERTEDIRLIYEDTMGEEKSVQAQQEKSVENKIEQHTEGQDVGEEAKQSVATNATNTPTQKPLTPGNKTPRRVALRTISTPKSKKKLLD